MKIATFNINNVNKRLANLLAWLRAARPDVVCLQELKSTDADFPVEALRRAGYEAVWRGQKTWNGVAILARGMKPVQTRNELPGDAADTQSRYIEAAVNGVIIGCLYTPNGNPQPGPKFDYKLAWLERLGRHARALLKAGVPVVLAGDYNVVPTPFDIYDTHSYDNDALVQPKSRAAFARLIKQGWTDAIRALHPDDRIYTYWSYMRNRWPRDAGLRLDHLLLSADVAKRLVASGVDREVRGKPNASDHAPTWVELRDVTATRRKSSATEPSTGRAKKAPAAVAPPARRPLLVIDGDSFAHRSYHALPKTIRRDRNRPAGAILGFANMLLRLYQAERPRAVLVAWDTLEAPRIGTTRSKSIRVDANSTMSWSSSSGSFRISSPPAASPMPRAQATKRTIFSPPPRRGSKNAAARCWWRAETVTRFNSPRSAARFFIRCAPARWRASVPPKCAPATVSTPGRCRISSRCAAIHPTEFRARAASARPARPICYGATAR
jgi:exodeoxyribonuclease III